jgi:hypothetical protein
VALSHTYAEEIPGGSSVTFTVSDSSGGSDSLTVPLKVEDAPFTLHGNAPTFVAGEPFNGKLAFFFDAGNGGGSTADYTATVDWGDNNPPSSAIVAGEPAPNGGFAFAVYGNHAYAGAAGTSYTIKVHVHDVGGTDADLSIPVTLAAPPRRMRILDDNTAAGAANQISIQRTEAPDGIAIVENRRTIYSGVAAALQSITLVGSAADDVDTIGYVPPGLQVIVQRAGNGIVNIGANGSVQDIAGSVSLTNATGPVQLNLDDSADLSPRSVTIGNGFIRGLAPGTINYGANALGLLDLRAGTGTRVTLDDSADTTGRRFTVSQVDATTLGVAGFGAPIRLHVSSGNALILLGGRGGNAFDVQGTVAGTTTTIDTGPGRDTVNVGSTANTLDAIQGALNVNGQGANTTLDISDQSTTVAQIYEVYASSIHRRNGESPFADNIAPIGYSQHPGRQRHHHHRRIG